MFGHGYRCGVRVYGHMLDMICLSSIYSWCTMEESKDSLETLWPSSKSSRKVPNYTIDGITEGTIRGALAIS